jgi:hypothetical protein
MKILLITDIHGNLKKFREILNNYEGELIFISGDITNFGPSSLIEELDEILADHSCIAYSVPGNCDQKDIVGYMKRARNIINLHGTKTTLGEFDIYGVGGSNPTPFQTPFELREDEIEILIKKFLIDHPTRKSILISHAPPHGILDRVPAGHVGSRSIKMHMGVFDIIICGHIHEQPGIKKINNTLVVNPGPALMGYYGIMDSDSVTVELKKV